MQYEYLFKEFHPQTEAQDIAAWLDTCGRDEWEAVTISPMLHMVGGLDGPLRVPPTPKMAYTFLLKRPRRSVN